MLVIGTFEHSTELEQLLAIIEHSGISRLHILVISMDTSSSRAMEYFGHQPDRYSRGIEAGMAFATAGSVVGTSVGFILEWGPIFWGIATAIFCFILGFWIYRLTEKGKAQRSKQVPEVTVIIQCQEEQTALITEFMWQYRALSVGRASNPVNACPKKR